MPRGPRDTAFSSDEDEGAGAGEDRSGEDAPTAHSGAGVDRSGEGPPRHSWPGARRGSQRLHVHEQVKPPGGREKPLTTARRKVRGRWP